MIIDTPIAHIDAELRKAIERFDDGDPKGARVELSRISDVVDGLLRSNLTNQLNAIHELKKAHEDVTRFYET